MGLDMYACKTLEQVTKPVDFAVKNAELIQAWRKHPNLHGWMESLYRKKGGAGRDFNCDTVLLTLEDLEQLESDVLNDALPCTDGFFFGNTHCTKKEEDLYRYKRARLTRQGCRAVLEQGAEVLGYRQLKRNRFASASYVGLLYEYPICVVYFFFAPNVQISSFICRYYPIT